MFALQKYVGNLLQNLYDITHLTLYILLHYLGKLKFKRHCNVTQRVTLHRISDAIIILKLIDCILDPNRGFTFKVQLCDKNRQFDTIYRIKELVGFR